MFDRIQRLRTSFQTHNLRVNTCLSQADLQDFEARYHITLPDPYRLFLLHIGNGSGFPEYGLTPLEQIVPGSYLQTYLHNDPLYLSKVFPLTSKLDLPALHAQRIGLHPYESAEEHWHAHESGYAHDASYKQLVDSFWSEHHPTHYRMGLLPIADYGCGICYSLVLTGSERGRMWIDDFANDNGLFPICADQGQHLDFLDWLEAELSTEINE